MPLTMLNIGETGKIKRIGGNEETRRFLNNLGFVVGAEVSVVSAIGGIPYKLGYIFQKPTISQQPASRYGGANYEINEDMAKRIMV